ncbi:MAG: ankyrin repeat domain-containing protein [Acidobacteriota bacterium]
MTAGHRHRLWPLGLAILLVGAVDQRPPLVAAARSAGATTVRALLQQGVDVNAAEADGTTALHWASYRDDGDSADLLIRAGARVNAANDLGATPLWTASLNGSEAMVRRLLAAGADPNAALLAGETPVMVAARAGTPAVIEQLIAKGANVNAHGTRHQTALMWAVSQKHPDAVKVLLAHGADIHARSETWSQVMAVEPHGYLPYNRSIPAGNETALLFAARVGDLASARLLVAAGANVDDADAWGVSATTLAAHSGYRELVELLLDHGADPNVAGPGFSALHAAIMRRDEKMVSALLVHHADASAPLRTWTPTRRSSEDLHFAPELVGATPFWLAARFDAPGVMRLLLAHGADGTFVHRGEAMTGGIQGNNGFIRRTYETTPLMAAAGMGGGGTAWVPPDPSAREPLMLETIKLAAGLGIDVNAANTDGRTALDAANTLEYATVIEFLVAQGAKPGPIRKADSKNDSTK